MPRTWILFFILLCLLVTALPFSGIAQTLYIYVDDAILNHEGDTGDVTSVSVTIRTNYSGLFRRVLVDYYTQDGTATAGSDYNAVIGTIELNTLLRSRTITVPVLGDDTPEPNEIFRVLITNARYGSGVMPTPTLVIADGSADVLIVDDDYAPYQISIEPVVQSIEGTPAGVIPGTNNVTLTLSLDRVPAPYHVITVDWSTGAGTATPVMDYMPAPMLPILPLPTVTFNMGEQFKTITITLMTEHHVESDETIPVTLSNPSSNAAILAGSALLVILDDDQADMVTTKELYTMDNVPVTGEVIAGESYRYTLRLRNNGPGNLWSMTGEVITVTDVLPQGLNYVSHTGLSGTYDGGTHTITWLVPLAVSWDFMAEYTAQVVVSVDPMLAEGVTLTNHLCAMLPEFTYYPGHEMVPDPDLDNNCDSFTVYSALPDVDFCSQFDSDRNVGLAPLTVHFHAMKKVVDPIWHMGDGGVMHQSSVTHTFMACGEMTEDYMVDFRGDAMKQFVTVYPVSEDAYATLRVVTASPSSPKEDWSNAVDGDTYWRNGTAMVTHDATGKPWAIFEFTDQTTKEITKLRLLTDTGYMNSSQQARHFRVLVSTTGTADGDFTELVHAEKTPIHDSPCDLNDDWHEIVVAQTAAKYIKLVIDTPESYWRALGEFEVYVKTALPHHGKSWLAAEKNDSGVLVTLHLFDADGQPLAGKMPDDIHFFAMPMYEENPNPQGCWGAWTETAPGVYEAQLACDVKGLKHLLASVNGMIIGHNQHAEVCCMMIGDEKIAENLIPVDPSLPANTLVFVKGSPTSKGEGWENAVDGDFEGWDGTTTAKGSSDDAGPAWAIFQFAGQGVLQFDRVLIQTDNGADDDAVAERQATKIEILVSTTGLADGDFTSVKMLHRRNGDAKWDMLGGMISARYIKLVLHAPVWQRGAWRQIVEFQPQTAAKSGAVPVGAMASLAAVPQEFQFEQNYPNPFNPSTSLRYQIPQEVHVTLSIFDVSGQQVARLVDENQSAGWHSVQWNAAGLPSGVYFARLTAGSYAGVKQMMLVK